MTNGGVFYCQSEACYHTIIESSFLNNSANDGGVIEIISNFNNFPSLIDLSSSSFVGNEATRLGAVIYAQGFRFEVNFKNSQFTGNSGFKGGVISLRCDSENVSYINVYDSIITWNIARSGGVVYFELLTRLNVAITRLLNIPKGL